MATLIPQFVIWGWPTMTEDVRLFFRILSGVSLIVLMGIIIYWLKHRKESEWSKQSSDKIEEPLLKIIGQVEAIEPIDYYQSGFGDVSAEGIKVLVKAVFNSTEQSLPITQFALEVSGLEIETKFPPKKVSSGSPWAGYFEIPKTLQIKNIPARLFARVGQTRYDSPEFPIPFKSIGEEKS